MGELDALLTHTQQRAILFPTSNGGASSTRPAGSASTSPAKAKGAVTSDPCQAASMPAHLSGRIQESAPAGANAGGEDTSHSKWENHSKYAQWRLRFGDATPYHALPKPIKGPFSPHTPHEEVDILTDSRVDFTVVPGTRRVARPSQYLHALQLKSA